MGSKAGKSRRATTYLIDGYNLLHRSFREVLVEGPLEDARQTLVSLIGDLAEVREGRSKAVLVFDGAEGEHGPSPGAPNLRVVFSRPPETADDVILDLCRRLEGEVDLVVVTSDVADIASRIRSLRCRHVTSEDFALRLDRGARTAAEEGGREEERDKPPPMDAPEVREWLREFDMEPDDEDWT